MYLRPKTSCRKRETLGDIESRWKSASVYYEYTTCMLRICYVYTTCILRVYYVYTTCIRVYSLPHSIADISLPTCFIVSKKGRHSSSFVEERSKSTPTNVPLTPLNCAVDGWMGGWWMVNGEWWMLTTNHSPLTTHYSPLTTNH